MEQCRALAERMHGPTRPVEKMTVGGLVMKGRQLPLSAAAGYEPYDARQRFVQEWTLDARAQSTASLLLGLRKALQVPILGDPAGQADQALSLWEELARRRVPVERVVRGALLTDMTRAIAIRAAAPFMAQTGDVPLDLSSEFRSALQANIHSDWPATLSAAVASWDDPQEMLTSISSEQFRVSRPMVHPEPAPPRDSDAPDLSIEVQLAFSPFFGSRVEEWLSRVLEDDLMAALRCATPPASVLLALPVDWSTRDEVGLWIWERLTLTHLDEWSTSSLLIEWRTGHGERRETECPPQVLAERRVETSKLADLALERMSSHHGHPSVPEGLNADSLTRSARTFLEEGRWQAAADIFAGLVALRPTDGDAWNNLGFCQLAGDVAEGLRSLQQASLFRREHAFLNTANRTLALHLLGRDDDALRISSAALETDPDPDPRVAVLWRHDDDHRLDIGSMEPRAYLTCLREHISLGNCASTKDAQNSSEI